MTIIIKNIKTLVCQCDNCGNEWEPKTNKTKVKKEDLPKVCPKCKSYNWNKLDKSNSN